MAYATASECLFFRIGMRLGAVGFSAAGGGRRSNIFHFASGVLTKIWGLGCPFFVHFRPVLGLFGICRLDTFVHIIFVNLKFSKTYVFSPTDARFRPAKGNPRPWKAEPWPWRIFSTAIQTGRKKSAFPRNGLGNLVFALIQTARKTRCFLWGENCPVCPARKPGVSTFLERSASRPQPLPASSQPVTEVP